MKAFAHQPVGNEKLSKASRWVSADPAAAREAEPDLNPSSVYLNESLREWAFSMSFQAATYDLNIFFLSS